MDHHGGQGNDDIKTGNPVSGLGCVIYAGEGADTIDGGGGADTVTGGAGNDVFYMRNAYTRILDPTVGDNIIISVQNFNRSVIDTWLANGVTVSIAGGPSNGQTWQGAAGNDTALGGQRSTMIGLAGNDDLHAVGNNCFLDGGDGDDTLQGQGTGNDTLLGGAGNDLFWVNGSNGEVMTGGGGNDTFKFEPRSDTASGFHTITDFTAGVDKIDLRPYGVLDPWLTFDASKSVLNADFNKDGKTDLSLTLTGVTSFDIGQNVLLK